MKKAFELLDRAGIRKISDAKNIFSFPRRGLVKLIEKLDEEICAQSIPSITKYSFTTNDSLGGGPRPCMSPECRLDKVSRLASFAALYADSVIIPPLFTTLDHLKKTDDHEILHALYLKIAGDISVLIYLRPYIEANLVYINKTKSRLCFECFRNNLSESNVLQSRIKKIEPKIKSFISREASFSISDGAIRIAGSRFLGTETLSFVHTPPEIAKFFKKKEYRFSQKEVIKYKLYRYLLGPSVNDLYAQKYSFQNERFFLTDNELETQIIDYLGGHRPSMVSHLSQNLPLVSGVKPEKIIKLRQEEGESFEAYRNSVSRVMEELGSKRSPSELKDAMSDLVQPEINRINLVIKNHKKYLLEKAAKRAQFDVLVLAAGLFGGLPIDPVSLNIIYSGLGLREVSGIIDDLQESKQIPEEARNSNLYFLWRIQKMQRKS
jgi:hypothetical protein